PRDIVWQSLAPAPRLVLRQGATRLLAWDAGNHALRIASGAVKTIEVPTLPVPVALTGPWDLTFQAPVGAPPKTTFAGLFSWPEHPDAAIRYFSGTATYRKSFDLPASSIHDPRSSILLDLGRVEVIAEVMLNGKDLGVLWKAPFQVDITAAARPGANDLEVRITNLWPNRLIGDEQFPDDVAWDGARISAWPEWMVKGTPRPVQERVTFTTWKHYQKESSLLPSGLLGPVTVRTGRWLDVK
ncbi:MAG: glycosyl hydrolase family 43, partial [Verrucomicrobia bacterium]|nr:glycosyl hydrolase family 43 [Verrucomicrobiota bacterium]